MLMLFLGIQPIFLNRTYANILPPSIQIKGTITDEKGEPIIGAAVHNDDKSVGVITDVDGKFSIQVPPNSTSLIISYLGYKTEIIDIKNEKNLKITLIEDTKSLDELVVVGYGSQKRATVTGSISTISSDDLLKVPVSNLATSLSGKMSGLVTVQQSGMPGGESPIIRIRGVSTTNGQSPLIIVDGVEQSTGGSWGQQGSYSGFEQMDPNEVESISILKDASATAVYGVRGANGVIIVTTKRGIKGKPVVSYTGNVSMTTPAEYPQMLNSADWFSYMNEGLINSGKAPIKSLSEIEKYRNGSDPLFYPNGDFVDLLFKEKTWKQQHNINIRGGADNVRYFISGGYLNEDGMLNNHPGFRFDNNYSFERYNLRTNFDIQFTKRLSASINIESRFENRGGPTIQGGDQNMMWKFYEMPAWYSPGFIDDQYVETTSTSGGQKTVLAWIFEGGNYRSKQSTINTLFNLKYDLDFITDGLSMQFKYAYDNWNGVKYSRSLAGFPIYQPINNGLIDVDHDGTYDTNDYVLRQNGQWGELSYQQSANAKNRKFYTELSLNYQKTFNGGHTVSGLLLGNIRRSFFTESQYSDIPKTYLGIVGRATYNYKQKYLAEVNLGINGSENFPDGKRYGVFPAFSAGWVVSEESFLKENDIISYLKLRGSYGIVGNDQIGGKRFLYLPGTFSDLSATYRPFFGDANTSQAYNGILESSLGNPNITWEKAYKTDIAIETKFFKDRLSFIFDYFTEKRSDILTNIATIPMFLTPDAQSGYIKSVTAPVNYAQVKNGGFEIELGWEDDISKDFSYFVKGMYSFTKNEFLQVSETIKDYPWMKQQGRSIGQPFGYIADGFYESYEEIRSIQNPISSFGTSTLMPGDIKYKDINGDGIIDFKDQVPIGYSSIPQITYSISAGFSYKGFDLNLMFQGAGNVSYIPGSENRIQFFENKNAFTTVENRWTPATASTATYPVLHSPDYNVSNSHNFQNSTFWTWDASYIRLKNVEIGYSLPIKTVKKLGLSKTRIYLNGQNLWTFDKLNFVDPEAAGGRLLLYPMMKIYNLGLNITF